MGFSNFIFKLSDFPIQSWERRCSFIKRSAADKDRFSDKPTLPARADNVGFSQINRVLLKKLTLSADNEGLFRETYFI